MSAGGPFSFGYSPMMHGYPGPENYQFGQFNPYFYPPMHPYGNEQSDDKEGDEEDQLHEESSVASELRQSCAGQDEVDENESTQKGLLSNLNSNHRLNKSNSLPPQHPYMYHT